jgi:hypothetical protein
MESLMGTRGHVVVLWTVVVTMLVEAITLYLRFRGRITATEFNRTAPLVLRIHHMFWSLPLLAVVPFVWGKVGLSGVILGIALGLIVSDLLHHFVVLPLIVGNTGWHWP